jgi:hypothetical protein
MKVYIVTKVGFDLSDTISAAFFHESEALAWVAAQQDPGNYHIQDIAPHGCPKVAILVDSKTQEVVEVFSTNRDAKAYRKQYANYEDVETSKFMVIDRAVDSRKGFVLRDSWYVEVLKKDGAEVSDGQDDVLASPNVDFIDNSDNTCFAFTSFVSEAHALKLARQAYSQHVQTLGAVHV